MHQTSIKSLTVNPRKRLTFTRLGLRQLVSEESVRNSIIVWLSQNDYELRLVASTRGRPSISRRRGRPHAVKPPDLIAKRHGQNYYYFIEAKGDPATTKFYEVIGEILIQMARTTPAAYGVALPISYKPIILQLLSLRAWHRAGFRILITKNHQVVEMAPSALSFDRLGQLR